MWCDLNHLNFDRRSTTPFFFRSTKERNASFKILSAILKFKIALDKYLKFEYNFRSKNKQRKVSKTRDGIRSFSLTRIRVNGNVKFNWNDAYTRLR